MIRTATGQNNPVIEAMRLRADIAQAHYNRTGSPLDRYELCRRERILSDALALLEACQ